MGGALMGLFNQSIFNTDTFNADSEVIGPAVAIAVRAVRPVDIALRQVGRPTAIVAVEARAAASITLVEVQEEAGNA
jgi:hypothetical protein